jgi:hypothetical protein
VRVKSHGCPQHTSGGCGGSTGNHLLDAGRIALLLDDNTVSQLQVKLRVSLVYLIDEMTNVSILGNVE